MILFYTCNGDRGDKIQQEVDIDTLEIVTSKYVIAIRTSGILVKDRNTKKLLDLTQDDKVFDTNLDLT